MEIVARLVTRAKSLRQGDVTIHLHLMEDEFVWGPIIVKQHAMSFPAQVAKFLIDFPNVMYFTFTWFYAEIYF